MDDQELTWADLDKIFDATAAEGLHRTLTAVPGLTVGAIAAIELFVHGQAGERAAAKP